jgi:hypothetical protein
MVYVVLIPLVRIPEFQQDSSSNYHLFIIIHSSLLLFICSSRIVIRILIGVEASSIHFLFRTTSPCRKQLKQQNGIEDATRMRPT